jgi:hypothetical protein
VSTHIDPDVVQRALAGLHVFAGASAIFLRKSWHFGMVSSQQLSECAQLSIRMVDDEIVHVPTWRLSTALMSETKPFRKFRWYKGQPHYSGSYWSSTESAHVVYESRLELSRLVLADFDRSVSRIFAQPLMIRARVDGRSRRHVPDYLLVRGSDLTFVAVKPRDRLGNPKVVETLAWVRDVVESSGWGFEVASEPLQPYFDNVRFLAGYRRAQLFLPSAVANMRSLPLEGMSFGEAVPAARGAQALARAALAHRLSVRFCRAGATW